MPNYNVNVHVCRSATATIETVLQTYLNSIDSSKTIRSISGMIYGTDSVLIVIVTDA
jgi:hypothetical protein